MRVWDLADPGDIRSTTFAATLHELEQAENVIKTVSATVMEEQRKSNTQEPQKPNRPQLRSRNRLHESQPPPAQQHNNRPPVGRK